MKWLRHYTYTVTSHRDGRRLTVERRSRRDGISWDVLQQIKNDVLGPDVLCVEIYPPNSDVVNELNRRHLWEVPVGSVPTFQNR